MSHAQSSFSGELQFVRQNSFSSSLGIELNLDIPVICPGRVPGEISAHRPKRRLPNDPGITNHQSINQSHPITVLSRCPVRQSTCPPADWTGRSSQWPCCAAADIFVPACLGQHGLSLAVAVYDEQTAQ